MTPAERFYAALRGLPVDRPAVVPKLWIDWALEHNADLEQGTVLKNPEIAMRAVVDAGIEVRADAARVFLFPRRQAIRHEKEWLHVDDDGYTVGPIDLAGGWSTRVRSNGYARRLLGSEEAMANYQLWSTPEPMVQNEADILRLTIPSAGYYERAGYGAMIDRLVMEKGNSIGLIGDCNSATLAFYVALRGMENALLDFYDHPDWMEHCMDKGVQAALARAAFFVRHGITTLRLNDSIANMSVISPSQFREIILPRISMFCACAHALSPDVRVYCHICGDVLAILEDLRDSGLDCIAPLDPLGNFTLAQAREIVGPHFPLMGGVNTMTLQNGSAEDVRKEAESCMAQAGGYYVLGSGCAVPRGASIFNVRALVDAAETVL